MSSHADRVQEEAWTSLYHHIVRFLNQYGKNGFKDSDDFFVVDENIVWNQHKVEINNLEILRPAIIKSLQRLLKNFSGWEIVIGMSVPDPSGHMRNMGLTIKQHEIVDGLQRQYLPEPYRNFHYEGNGLRD